MLIDPLLFDPFLLLYFTNRKEYYVASKTQQQQLVRCSKIHNIYIYIYIHGGLAAAKCHGTLDVTRKCQAFIPSLIN